MKGLLGLWIICLLMTGCSIRQDKMRQGVAPHDVLTLTEVAQDKIMLTMRTGDGMDVQRIVQAIETKFPNVDIVVKHNTFDVDDLQHDDFQDIMLSGTATGFRKAPEGALIDLSAQEFVSRYYLAALNDCEMNGKLYYLPGPSTVTGIVYDKELFDQNGWEPATSLDEFIALCQKIDATGIRAIQPTLKYNSAARLLFSGFTYTDSFAGIDGYQWFEDYKIGKSTMVGHMEPGFEIMQRLLDAGIWRASDFDVSPIRRSEMLYTEHTTAMIIETQMACNYAKQNGEGREHEIAMMPFFSGNEEGNDYLIADPTFYIGLNAHLKDEGNEARLQAALDILDYISSIEGQQAIICDETPLLSNVIGAETLQTAFMSDVQKTITEGRVVNTPYYWGNQNSEIDVTFGKKLREFAEGKANVHDVLSACDEMRDQLLKEQEVKGTLLGHATKDFTVMETALYFADAFRDKGKAQIGLCLANSRELGIVSKIYKGDIYTDLETSLGRYLQKYFVQNKDENTMMVVSMTGENIKEAFNQTLAKNGLHEDGYLVASGLNIEFAPWAEDGTKYRTITLEDGSELKDDELYDVAVWSGIIDPSLISESKEVYTDTITDIFAEAIENDGGTIKPLETESFILNWDISASEQ